jgi:hypothetical protein
MASSVTYLLGGTVTGASSDPIQLPFSVAVGDPFSVVITVSQTAVATNSSNSTVAQYSVDSTGLDALPTVEEARHTGTVRAEHDDRSR